MKRFFKILAVILITILGLASILFTIPFSRDVVKVDIGTVVIGAFFLIYALVASYAGSILMFSSSFWNHSRKMIWFLAVSSIVYFVLILNNVIVFIGGGPRALIIFAPLILYVVSAFRLFRRLARGRL